MRIVELSTFVASPLGGMTLAQLGADVIRVDLPGGGPDRHRWPLSDDGESLYWAGLNKGKRSVTIDYRTDAGIELVAGLVAADGADGGIFLTNSGDRPGLRHADLVRRRPDVICIHLSGREDGRTAVDYTVNAAVGFATVTGPEGYEVPLNHVLPAWDVACGLYMAVGLLAADRARRNSGASQKIEIALHDVALATAGNLGFLAEAELNGVERPKIGNSVYGLYAWSFRSVEGRYVMVVVITRRHWLDLVAMTGSRARIEALENELDADFTCDADRYVHRERLNAVFQRWFGRHTLDHVEMALHGTSVVWSRFSSFVDLVGDAREELEASRIIGRVGLAGGREHLAPGSPLVFNDEPVPPSPAPSLGQQTAEVLHELLGIGRGDLDSLATAGVIGI